jgi:hypothetical protein
MGGRLRLKQKMGHRPICETLPARTTAGACDQKKPR